VDTLNDVSAVVEDPPDVLGVHRAGEVGVAVVRAVLPTVRPARLLAYLQEVISYKVLGSGELFVCASVYLRAGLRRDHIVHELGEVVLQLGLPGLDLALEEVLLVEEENHRYCS